MYGGCYFFDRTLEFADAVVDKMNDAQLWQGCYFFYGNNRANSIYSGKVMSTKSEVRWRFFSIVMLIVLAALIYVLVKFN